SLANESLANNLSSLKSCNIPTYTSDCVGDQASIAKQQVIRKYIDPQPVDPQQQGKFFVKNETLHDRSDSDRSRTELLAPILVSSDQIQALSLTSHQQQFTIGQVGALSLLHTDYSPGEYPSSHKVSHYCWGMLAVQQYDRHREWENWEIDTLKQLTKLIAIAIRQQEQIAQVKRETTVRKSLEAKLNSHSQQLQTNLEKISKLQEQLLESQKMSNLGQLTIDMLSEIHKPADFIYKSLESASQYAQDLIEFLENDQSHPDRVQNFSTSNIQYLNLESVKTDFPNLLWSMGAGSERIKDIVGNLQIFVSNQEQIERIDIHQEIDRTLQLLQYRLKEQPTRSGIQVIKNFDILPLVEGYRGEIAQVLINLIANAIDALEERMEQDYSFIPTIWVNTSSIANHLSLVEKDPTQTSGGKSVRKSKVIIKITDNGKGILPHIQRQIFEPLFTTKSNSKTKGLGLSICQQIIAHKYRGKLKCNSRLGEGSEFVIEINAKYPNLSYARKNTDFLNP
ncbi:MAG: ATP-binding protein, partial [Cyanobacteria bacterium J06639_18]